MKKKVKILSIKLVVVINVVFKLLFKRWFLVRSPRSRASDQKQSGENVWQLLEMFILVFSSQPFFKQPLFAFRGIIQPAIDQFRPFDRQTQLMPG